MTMFRKFALGLVAAAALSAAALAPTAASAKPFGPGWRWGGGWGFHHHIGLGVIGAVAAAESCYVTRLVETPYGMRYRTVNVCY
jgi:hypothetical protein